MENSSYGEQPEKFNTLLVDIDGFTQVHNLDDWKRNWTPSQKRELKNWVEYGWYHASVLWSMLPLTGPWYDA